MSNILIINGAKKFGHSNGQLNDTLTEVADGILRDLGHDVKVVRADSPTVAKRKTLLTCRAGRSPRSQTMLNLLRIFHEQHKTRMETW